MRGGASRLAVLIGTAWLIGGCTAMQQPMPPPTSAQRQIPSVAEFERLNLEVERLREQLQQFALLSDEIKRLGAERQFLALCHEVAQVLLAWHGAAATAQELIGTDAYPGALEVVEQRWEALRGAGERLTEVRWLLGGRICPASEPVRVLAPAPVPTSAPMPRRNSSRR